MSFHAQELQALLKVANERIAAGEDASAQLDEADELIAQLRIDARGKEAKKELADQEAKIRELRNRAKLFSGSTVHSDATQTGRQRIIDTHSRAEDASRRLEKTHEIISEIEETGNDIMNELSRNKDTLHRIDGNVKETKGELDKAGKIVTTMSKWCAVAFDRASKLRRLTGGGGGDNLFLSTYQCDDGHNSAQHPLSTQSRDSTYSWHGYSFDIPRAIGCTAGLETKPFRLRAPDSPHWAYEHAKKEDDPLRIYIAFNGRSVDYALEPHIMASSRMLPSVLLLVAVSLAGAVSKSPPSIPASFTAKAILLQNGESNPCSFSPGEDCAQWPLLIVQDDENNRSITVFDTINRLAPAAYHGTAREWFNTSVIQQKSSAFTILSNLCYPTDNQGVYRNAFGWLERAQYAGKVEVAGVECDAWEWRLGTKASYYLALANESVPILFNTSTAGQALTSYYFVSFEAGAAGADELFTGVMNGTDCYDPPICEEDPSIVEMDAYIFHPEDSFNVADQNVGGDTFFVCEDLLSGPNNEFDHDYALLTHYKLRRVGTIGQYRNCNGYPPECIGQNNYYVGREAALGLGYPAAGQCTPNVPTGSWWSLPSGGQCASPDQVGVNCTWAVTHVKTINGTCLFKQHAFYERCIANGHAPFIQAELTFKQAFKEDDVAAGGCPPIPSALTTFPRQTTL